MEQNVKNALDDIKKSIDNECVSLGELSFLEDHKKEVLEYGDITLAEWGGISEDEWRENEIAE